MKKACYLMVVVIGMCSMGLIGNWVAADQKKPTTDRPDKSVVKMNPSKARLNVGVVNLTQVIKHFNSANATGDSILKAAKEYELELKAEKERLDAEQKRIDALANGDEKDEGSKMLRQGRNALQEKEAGYQSKIRKRRDQMAVQVNKQIHDEMGKIATRRELELVLTYPGAQSKEEEDDLADAMHRVQAPAVWVGWYSPKLDITEELIAALNNDYPPRENQ